MEPDSQAKRSERPVVTVQTDTLDRMITALQKTNQLMEHHLAAGEKTVPARALYFILRDAGFGTSTQKQEVKQAPKEQHQVNNELHHNYQMRR
jgi:hypothetical protein